MAIVRINNLGQLGIIKDVPPHELPPEAWSDGKNVRFCEGNICKMPGEERIYNYPSIAPHWLLPWITTAGHRWIYAGVSQVQYVVASGNSTNITRFTTVVGDNDYSAGSRPVWTGGVLHGLPILNNDAGVDYPQSWNVANNRLEDLPNWPANFYAKVIRVYGDFLIALNITSPSGSFPYTVKWSHPADPGAVPITWDESDPTKLAGENTLSRTTGFVVDCLPLREVNIIYKTDSIWSMRLTQSQLVFAFNEISTSLGAIAVDCVREFFGQHFVVGANDIVLFDGNQLTSVINKRMRSLFYNDLSSTYWDKTYVTVNYPEREIWICYVSGTSVNNYPDKALIWSWERNSWTIKELPDIAYSEVSEVSQSSAETFNASSGEFNVDFGPFNQPAGSPATVGLLHVKPFRLSPTVGNLLSDPNSFDQPSWILNGTPVVTSNTDIAPDGTTTADTLQDDDGVLIEHFRQDASSFDVTKSYTCILFVKKDGVGRATRFPRIRQHFAGSTTENNILDFDTATGEFNFTGESATPSSGVEDYDGNYWRVWVSGTSNDPANTTMTFYIYPARGQTIGWASDAAATGSIVAWRAQIHEGNRPETSAFLKGDTNYQSDGSNYEVILERTGLPIAGSARDGSPKVDPTSIKFIRSVFPKISAPTNVTIKISVGMQEVVGGPVTWEGPYDFTIGVDTRIDTALSGRFFAIKFEDTSNLVWEFTGYELDIDLISVN